MNIKNNFEKIHIAKTEKGALIKYKRRQMLIDSFEELTHKELLKRLFEEAEAYDQKMDFSTFCEKYNYNSDSINDLSIYNEFLKNGYKLKKLFANDYEEIREKALK
jgi:hypothetical protein